METSQENEAYNTSDDDENDNWIVTIGEHTDYEPIAWRFPHTDTCPKVYCKYNFGSRLAAKQHYCKMHAKTDLLCKECDRLISMTGPQHQNKMANHFLRNHQNASVANGHVESDCTPPPPEKSCDDAALSPDVHSSSSIDRMIDLSRRSTHHNSSDPSQLKESAKPNPNVDGLKEQMRKLDTLTQLNVSTSKSVYI